MAPFDPVVVARRLKADLPHLNDIRIIDRHGWQLSMTEPTQVEPEVLEQVKNVIATRQIQDMYRWNRVVRYIPLPDSVGELSFGLRMQVVRFDYNLNRVMFFVGANLMLVLAALVLVLRLSHSMKQVESRLHSARESAEAANQRLAELSATDGLTGIANRRRFDEVATSEWSRSIRNGNPLALLMLDVDAFKAYNDGYGHQAGDEVLKQIANVLRDNARRTSDFVARYGGEEFVVIAADTNVESARTMAEGIRADIESLAMPHRNGSCGVVTVSIGVAVATAGTPDVMETWIGMADSALYKAKNAGRNRVELADLNPAAPVDMS